MVGARIPMPSVKLERMRRQKIVFMVGCFEDEA